MNVHHAFNDIELPSTDNDAMERFYGGVRFHLTDPSGNELAVWTPA